MVNVGKEMMGNMIVKPSKNKIGGKAKGVHIVRTFNLIHHPGTLDDAQTIRRRIIHAFYMMGHKKGKKQKERLHHMHQEKRKQYPDPILL